MAELFRVGPDAVDDAARARFFEGGYVIASGLFDDAQLEQLSAWGDEMPSVEGPIQQLEFDDAGDVIPNRTEALADFHQPCDSVVHCATTEHS